RGPESHYERGRSGDRCGTDAHQAEHECHDVCWSKQPLCCQRALSECCCAELRLAPETAVGAPHHVKDLLEEPYATRQGAVVPATTLPQEFCRRVAGVRDSLGFGNVVEAPGLALGQ